MHTNRLAREKSPYLLQHAANPVDWYPWGAEAFEKARTEDKPIFLSVGYSTCHWCHVMERESFENERIAALLNQHFVPVKVDREERPDVDRIYMLFVQASTGSGGWPMSVFMTPELKPFFGGTYFPPDNRYGRPGFATVLERLAEAWANDRARIEESSAAVTVQLAGHAASGRGQGQVDAAALDAAFHVFRRNFDKRLGGFGGAPKFPRPVVHNFLLRYYRRTGNDDALQMTLTTLREMAKGGMNDQVGGGFHRYSVDERWFVPHFEKMLYDQAQLAVSYLEAYQITREETFAQTARDIFEYVLRDLTHPEGGFFSAEDADSVVDPAEPRVKGEGAFYIWSDDELARLLDARTLAVVRRHYGVERDGNVEHDPHGEFHGRNIPYRAAALRTDEEREAVAAARRVLLEARSKRVRPHLDDKVLTAWNALMISAFAKGAQVLGEERYAQAARRAMDFVLRRLFQPETATLLRRFREGEAAIPGFLDDYAFLVVALIDLYETQFETYHLELAAQLAGRMIELFEDGESGGFFSTAEDDADLILRMQDDHDGAEPSGNSMAAMGLLRLAHTTGREDFRRAAERTLECFTGRSAAMGSAMPQMLAAAGAWLDGPRQIVVAGERGETAAMLGAIRRRFLPETAVFAVDGAARETLAAVNPVFAEMKPVNGLAAAYVCENFACRLPVTEVSKLTELLQ
ncbi:MAG: thioredoxin domain-containing protein [Acidobacteria bacterium]|nr:thioredoxin domain-containing protein [Acidobacteriota bacterium]